MLQSLAAVVLLLSRGFAPVTDAVTHGPGTLAAKADHAAWHAERADLHHRHDATDHDHSTAVILPPQDAHSFDPRAVIEGPDLPVLTETIRDDPRRPPRPTGPTA